MPNPVTPLSAAELPWRPRSLDRSEDRMVLPDDPELLADYALDLREDLRTVRGLLSETLALLESVTRERNTLRKALKARG